MQPAPAGTAGAPRRGVLPSTGIRPRASEGPHRVRCAGLLHRGPDHGLQRRQRHGGGPGDPPRRHRRPRRARLERGGLRDRVGAGRARAAWAAGSPGRCGCSGRARTPSCSVPGHRSSAALRLGMGRLDLPDRVALVPLPGGSRHAPGGGVVLPAGVGRLVVGNVPVHRRSAVGSPARPGGTPRAADASGVQGAEIFFALVMVAALVLWGLVLRKITREQHAKDVRRPDSGLEHHGREPRRLPEADPLVGARGPARSSR